MKTKLSVTKMSFSYYGRLKSHILADICFLTQNRLLPKVHKLPCRLQKSSK